MGALVNQVPGDVVAVPDAGHAEGGAAHKVQVVLIVRGAGFAKQVDAILIAEPGQLAAGGLGAEDGPVEQLVHNGGPLLAHHPGALGIPVVQNHIVVVVLYVIVAKGLVVNASVGKNLVPGGHFLHRDAPAQAAQRHGGAAVGVSLGGGGEVQGLGQPLVAGLGCQSGAKLGRRSVDGPLDGLVHAHVFFIHAVPVGRAGFAALAVPVGQGLVL